MLCWTLYKAMSFFIQVPMSSKSDTVRSFQLEALLKSDVLVSLKNQKMLELFVAVETDMCSEINVFENKVEIQY